MSFYLGQPAPAIIDSIRRQNSELPLSYTEVGATRGEPPQGYVVDRISGQLGSGRGCFDRACAAMNRWQHLQLGWVEPCWPQTPIELNQEVGIVVKWFGIHFLNVCRVVYLIHDSEPSRRFGYAYGTLRGHAECGEERFQIEWRADDSVWYDILAFSKPARWYSRLGYPLVRRLQKRFARDSLQALQDACR